MTAKLIQRLRGFARGETGAAAMEFVMVIPVALALIFGVINAGFMMYAGATLHFAAEDAARCRAVGTYCTTDADTQTYAASRYFGPTAAPTFTPSMTATCSQVSATATYVGSIGIASYSFPVQADACYPLQPTT